MKVRITRTTYEHCDIDIDPEFARDGKATPGEVVKWLEGNLSITGTLMAEALGAQLDWSEPQSFMTVAALDDDTITRKQDDYGQDE